MKAIVIQKSANNEVRIGWQDLPPTKRKRGDKSDDKVREYYAKQVALTETEVLRVGERAYLIDRINGCSVITQNEADNHERQARRALDIISDFQRTKGTQNDTNKPGWGYDPKVTVFGKYARHTILEAGAITSRRSGDFGRGVEVTLTIPGHSRSAFRAVSQWSGYAVNRLLQTIRRHKEDIEWFYVWELQKRGALHLHMALSGVRQSELLRVGRKIRKCWYRVLEEIARKSGVNVFFSGRSNRTNSYRQFLRGNRVAEIRKSLGAYFAKYVSKKSSKASQATLVHAYPPARWWGIARKLLAKVKGERLNVRFTNLSERELCDMLSIAFGFIGRYNPVRSCSYSFELSYGSQGHAIPIGSGWRWLGWFSDTEFSSIQVWLPQLLRFLSNYCINAVIEGDITWMAK